MIFGWASPHPGLGSPVELRGRDASSLLNLLGISKALPRQRIASEEAPPALLQVEPAGPRGDEDMVDAGMIDQPSARLQAAMTAEIVRDDEDVAAGIVGFDVGEQSDIALGIA